MEKPSWAPIVLSGAIPHEGSDLLAITVMGIVALETALATVRPGFSDQLLLSLLVVPPTCALASISATTRRVKEELALFAYGGSTHHILFRYFFRGLICTAVGFSPLIVEWAFSLSSIPQLIELVGALAVGGGLFYSLPGLRRIRSTQFVENYKS